jgi:thioredoxin reductase
MYDVITVGGGPAGLNAALVLARARRRVLLVDAGCPRNDSAQALHGFLSRDGINPHELLKLGRAELARYGVEFLSRCVATARCLPPEERQGRSTAFEIRLDTGQVFLSRKLLLATGVVDKLPQIEGIRTYYGKCVHHCPHCDGWEYSDRRLAAIGSGAAAVGLALSLRTWTEHVTACTEGVIPSPEDRCRAERNGIAIREERAVRVEGSEDRLERIVFASGPPLECDAIFFNTEQAQRSNLPAMLGCGPDPAGHGRTRRRQRTKVPGLFLAGDAGGEVQFAIVAAARGAIAGVTINRELQDEDRGEKG